MNRKSVGILLVLLLLSLALVGCLFAIPGMKPSTFGIQGTVFDQENAGIGQVAVLVDSKMVDVTGADGTWSYADAKKGAKVTVQKAGWDFAPESITVTNEDEMIWFEGSKHESNLYAVSGKVVDGDGRGIPVVVISFSGTTETEVTNNQGEFTREGLEGTVTISASKDGYTISEPIEVSGPRSSITFIAQEDASAAYAVSGKVVDGEGIGIPSVTITFTGAETVTTVTNTDGEFSRSDLAGSVTITAAKAGYEIPASFDVEGSDSNILFVATKTAPAVYAVSGEVLSRGGLAIEGALISLRDDDDRVQTVLSGLDGSFSKSDLAGRLKVTISHEGWDFEPQDFYVDEANSDLNFYGTPNIGTNYTASGGVVDSAGEPVPAVMVKFELLDFADGEDLWTLTADGVWQMNGLLGRVRITPEKEGYDFTPQSQTIDRGMESLGFLAVPAI